jgi:threonylcarbamoyladenosine tRNA methylthiotransferase MtaB
MDTLAYRLPEYDCVHVSSPEEADILIVNTCAVTETAQREGEKYLKKIKSKNPSLKIVATGCVAELQGDTLGVDLVVRNADKDKLLDVIGRANPTPTEGKAINLHTRAFLKIQDGCDSFCTYCIIPALRGAPHSVPADDVVIEAKRLLDAGYKEIVLTGIHIGLYEPSLVELLRRLTSIEGEFRLRLTSLYVQDITLELVELIANSNKLCPHIHISLQSGSAKILQAMGRCYSPSDFVNKVALLRERVPLVNIGADLIVGFPTESDEDFADTMKLLSGVELDYLHIFPYSKRPGTVAAEMDGQIAYSVKRKRAPEARELDKMYRQSAERRMAGHTLRVLSERGGRGHADNYYEVTLPDGTPSNEFIYIKL